jgi:hypothetical protein
MKKSLSVNIPNFKGKSLLKEYLQIFFKQKPTSLMKAQNSKKSIFEMQKEVQ